MECVKGMYISGGLAMTGRILAWHFLKDNGCLQYVSEEPVFPGQVLHVEPPLKICKRGLHASIRAIDALRYSPGKILCRVECWGEVLTQDDKICCEYRKCIWMVDATATLHKFAVECAEEALTAERTAGREPHPDSWAAVEAKRQWLAGAITYADLCAAWSAARSAAWSAARSAAWSAARSAAESAAWSAAWSAAESDEWSAAWSAAWMAAESAAWSAAESTARSSQNQKLEEMLNQLHKENQ